MADVTLAWADVPKAVRGLLCPVKFNEVTLDRFDDGRVWACCDVNAYAAFNSVLPDPDKYDADDLAVLMDWADSLV